MSPWRLKKTWCQEENGYRPWRCGPPPPRGNCASAASGQRGYGDSRRRSPQKYICRGSAGNPSATRNREPRKLVGEWCLYEEAHLENGRLERAFTIYW